MTEKENECIKLCKKTQILQSATKMFASKGFEGSSIRELASAANVNIAMINYYFGSKEKLFAAVINYHSEYMQSALKEIAAKTDISNLEKLYMFIDLQVNKVVANRDFHKLMHYEIMLNQREEVSDIIQTIVQKHNIIFRELIGAGIKSGEFRQVDTELILCTLFGTINQIFLSRVICNVILQNKDLSKDPFDEKLQKRLSNFLKDLMAHYLVKTPE